MKINKLVIGFWSLVIVWSLVFGYWSLVHAMGGPAPNKKAAGGAVGVLLIDDFESGSLRSPREWWTFDLRKAEIEPNKDLRAGEQQAAKEAGDYSLGLQGTAINWYAGGCGTYIAKENQDLSKYNFMRLDVYGNGPGSGTLKIELYDDDNNNWQPEQDPANNYAPVYDDKYVYDLSVDWDGWKRVYLPLDDFADDNSGVGDDVWNPQQSGGSGGLLQVQFICIGGSDSGGINYNIDNVLLAVEEE